MLDPPMVGPNDATDLSTILHLSIFDVNIFY